MFLLFHPFLIHQLGSSPRFSRLITTTKLFRSAHTCHATCQQHIISLNDERHATSTIACTLERPLRAYPQLLPYGANQQPSRCSRISMTTFENSQTACHSAVTALRICSRPRSRIAAATLHDLHIPGNAGVSYLLVKHENFSPSHTPHNIHSISTTKGWTCFVTHQYCALMEPLADPFGSALDWSFGYDHIPIHSAARLPAGCIARFLAKL